MISEQKEESVEKFECKKSILLINGEVVNIYFKEARLIDIGKKKPIGDLVGHIDVIYLFAGLELKLTLEIYNEIVDEELNIVDGVFKIPFANVKIPMHDIFYQRELLEEKIFREMHMDLKYDKCSCGGYMTPMYDEFPTWITFCISCDSRHENVDSSPIKEPVY